MKSLAVFVLVFAVLARNGLALRCRKCDSFEECGPMGDIQQCDAAVVNANHANHREDNPTLLPGDATEFKCYRIQISRMHPNGTDAGTRSYARGCTFNSTNFCSGWNSDLNVTSCDTCTTDNCDQNTVAPTPEESTPTVAPRETTTMAPGVTKSTVQETTTAAGTATTTVATETTTTMAPGMTKITVPETTSAAGTANTTVAPVATTNVAPVTTTTMAPGATTTMAPGATTTVVPKSKTTVNPRAVTTTSKKPSTGGTSSLQTGMATLAFTSILVLVLAGQ